MTSDFINNLETPLQDFATRVEAFFKSAGAKFVQFEQAFLPKVEVSVEVALEDLAEIAGQAVLDQAASVLSGQEKFGTAVTSVVQTVEASGKTVAMATAQASVQNAYLVAQSLVKGN